MSCHVETQTRPRHDTTVTGYVKIKARPKTDQIKSKKRDIGHERKVN